MCTRKACRLALDARYARTLEECTDPTLRKYIIESIERRHNTPLDICHSCKVMMCGFCTKACMACNAMVCGACHDLCTKYEDFDDDRFGCNGVELCFDCIKTCGKIYLDGTGSRLRWMCSVCYETVPELKQCHNLPIRGADDSF